MINSPLDTKSFIRKNIWIVVVYNTLLIIFTASAKFEPGINGFDILLIGYSVIFAIIHTCILLCCFLFQKKNTVKNFGFKIFAYVTLTILILNFIFMLLNFLLNFVVFSYLYSHNLF